MCINIDRLNEYMVKKSIKHMYGFYTYGDMIAMKIAGVLYIIALNKHRSR